MSNIPRGIRNNNPGNIRWGSNWSGLDPRGKEKDKSFCVFLEPVWGIRALVKLLLNYKRIYGLNTVNEIINRYAPTNENDTNSYAIHVARVLDVCADEEIDIYKSEIMMKLVKAIIMHENGVMPYDDDLLKHSLTLAGIVCEV